MRIGRTAALASTVVSQGHSSLRFAVAALAFLFVASSVPVAAATSAEEPERAAVAGAETGWLLDVHDLLQEAFAAITDAAVEEADAQPSQVSAARTQRQQAPKRFRMNLFRTGDFSSQKTTFWCIPASTQMMMNMMDSGKPDRSRAMQARLYRIGDRLEEDGTFSPDPEPDRWRGMGISEWVGLLNRYDYGPYELAGAKSYQKALRKAARMMRKTGKPVGLVVWHGAHAWVMSGFTATADPAVSKDFEVTSVWVQDPWYPRTSSIWGRSRGPNANVSPRVLRQDFKRYGRPGRRNPDRDGRFMLVLPRPDGEVRAAS